VFNRPDSGAFQDALIVKGELEKQLQKLVEAGVIKKEDSILPDLGEIPTYEDPPAEEVEDAGEDEEESTTTMRERRSAKGLGQVFRSERHSVTKIARRHGDDRPSS
jgi:predicted transcriptional regulator